MMNKQVLALAAIAIAGVTGTARADVFFLNFEAPGVENTTASFSLVGVQTFDTKTSMVGFTTHFHTGSAITATYSPVQINNADQYGGAGGTGKYAVAFANTPYWLDFTTDATVLPHGVNYFGYWLSALDQGNHVSFYCDGVEVGSLSPGDVLDRVRGNRAYFGNPNPAFAGQDANEPFVFINFYDTTGSFDEVRVTQTGGGGYESDNHTIGYYTRAGGVPEPASWALLVTGFGLVGAGLRRSGQATRRAVTTSAA